MAPSPARSRFGIEQQERQLGSLEKISHRQRGLPAANHDDIE